MRRTPLGGFDVKAAFPFPLSSAQPAHLALPPRDCCDRNRRRNPPGYRSGALSPADIVARSFARIRAHADPAIFITLREEADVLAEAEALTRTGDKRLPLYGIPVAVKDNIDVKGLPTTAACPAFLYRPGRDATAVAKLRAAGAIVLGKTKSRSIRNRARRRAQPVRDRPQSVRQDIYSRRIERRIGACRGRRVRAAVTRHRYGWIGRVPAAYSNIVGLKPSRASYRRRASFQLAVRSTASRFFRSRSMTQSPRCM